MPVPVRAIDRLRKAANLEPTKKVVELSDGTEFEMWVTPLTMAERERAQKQAKSDDAGAFALQLLITKALDESGAKLFNAGEVDVLKNEVKDKDLQTSDIESVKKAIDGARNAAMKIGQSMNNQSSSSSSSSSSILIPKPMPPFMCNSIPKLMSMGVKFDIVNFLFPLNGFV